MEQMPHQLKSITIVERVSDMHLFPDAHFFTACVALTQLEELDNNRSPDSLGSPGHHAAATLEGQSAKHADCARGVLAKLGSAGAHSAQVTACEETVTDHDTKIAFRTSHEFEQTA